jgi:ribosomal-protein-alanine N-acetyltransferase
MFELQRVRLDHEASILDFELANRSYFAASINDRGDEFFREFTQQHRKLLTEQEAGDGAFFLLVDEDQSVVGRFNLYDIDEGTADVGYRVAQSVAGRGVATSGLRQLCQIAHEEIGLVKLKAVTSTENVASQRVLTKVGFEYTGSVEVVGRPGYAYELAMVNP